MTAVDAGDAFELTFASKSGAAVTATWEQVSPVPQVVLDDVSVTESPAGSGLFPYTFVAATPGMWRTLFTASGNTSAVEEHYVRVRALAGPAPLAVIGDVTEQYGSMTAAQDGLTRALLRAASKLVRSRYPVDTQIADGDLDADVVALAVTNMVLRVLRNPAGLRSETVGPFSRTYDTTAAAGLLVITAAEQQMLTPVTAETAPTYAIGTTFAAAGMAPARWRRPNASG